MASGRTVGLSLAPAIFLSIASCSATLPSGPVTLEQVPLPAFVGMISTPVAVHQVIADSSSWAQVWSLITRSASEPPAVDFSRDVVLFTSMGPQPSSGYVTKIHGATLDSHGRLVVAVTEIAQNCNGLPIVVYPTDAMTVSRAYAARTVFQITKIGPTCGP